MSKARKKQIAGAVSAYLDTWRTGDRQARLNLFSDDAVLIDPVGTPAYVGKVAITEFWNRVHSNSMTFDPKVDRIVICGNEGVVNFTMESRGESGAGMAVDIIEVFVVNEAGKVSEMRAYWDGRCTRALASEA